MTDLSVEGNLSRLLGENSLERLKHSRLLQRRLAKYIVRLCFRDNTNLESIHAGPNSRISQSEMRTLMRGAVQNCYTVIGFLVGSYDSRPGLYDLVDWTFLLSGTRIEDKTKMPTLLDVLEKHDFNPNWSNPRTSGDLGLREARRRIAEQEGRNTDDAPHDSL